MALLIAKTANQYRYLAQVRLDEAHVLLRNRRWAGALYVAGYIVECGMKAVIARYNGNTLPPQYLTHDLNCLRQEVVHHLRTEDALVVQQIGGWTHLLRYCTQSPTAESVTMFVNRAKDVLRCLLSYL